MSGNKTEAWTVKELSDALQNNHKDNKRIVVPMFQRGQRWKKSQQQTFIDSLISGYPVGSMLFYEKYEGDQWVYILVDGLQRGNCIRHYMTNPTDFFYNDTIPEKVCNDILSLINEAELANYPIVRSLLTDFIKEQKCFNNIQFYTVAGKICQSFGKDHDYQTIERIIKIITDFFQEKQDLYDKIASTTIPVCVYSGSEDTLPVIFERINSKGTALNQYEIYAAAWPVNDKFTINNSNIIEYIIKKYDTLVDAGYTIHGYNREDLRHNKRVNAFEYLFGLSRYLVNTFDILAFDKNISDDEVNPLAFELVNACLNDTDRISSLYQNIAGIDINAFEAALINAIKFVIESISIVTRFKGNARNAKKIFHSKYQIMSMISTSFKEMYSLKDFSSLDPTWVSKKPTIAKNLVQYYVYDIITNYWNEGGTGKIHAAAKPNRYLTELSGRSWTVALDSFFERSMLRSEVKNVANPKSEEYVILNCIYVKTFTAMDQLSIDRFDVEHIAPKDQMKKLITKCKGDGLPISCIANLCYLPESANRSKGAKNFYQDKKYRSFVDLAEVEAKYSFTEEEDLDWMDMPYDAPQDFAVLKEYYVDYCSKRFEKLKRLLCESLGIAYVSSSEVEDEQPTEVVVSPNSDTKRRPTKFADRCILRIAEDAGEDLIKLTRGSFKSRSNENGYALVTSKAYTQGKREKFWFAYRKTFGISNCTNQYYIFGCKDETIMLKIPVSVIESNLKYMNYSTDEDGNISHWHIVFFRDLTGHMTWFLSKATPKEINIDDYLF